jgi:hypothetical protein
VIWPVQSSLRKYSASPPPQIKSISVAVPSHTEGRFANVTDVGAGCDGRSGALTTCLLRTAKSCGPDTPTLVSSWRTSPSATVARKPGHRGERDISRKPLRAGMPGVPVTCGDDTRVLPIHCTRGCGCIGRPAFPTPSVFRAKRSCTTSGVSRREIAGARLGSRPLLSWLFEALVLA